MQAHKQTTNFFNATFFNTIPKSSKEMHSKLLIALANYRYLIWVVKNNAVFSHKTYTLCILLDIYIYKLSHIFLTDFLNKALWPLQIDNSLIGLTVTKKDKFYWPSLPLPLVNIIVQIKKTKMTLVTGL